MFLTEEQPRVLPFFTLMHPFLLRTCFSGTVESRHKVGVSGFLTNC